MSNIRLFRPWVGKEELESISKVIDMAWLGHGELVQQFEYEWEQFIGAPSVATNSATAALHLALLGFGFNKGGKVLVPSLTFAATAFAPVYCGLEPIFVDIDSETLTIDPKDLEKKYTLECVAIVVVHFGGEAADMDAINEFAKSKNLKVIEDCAHSQGGLYKNKKLGTLGDVGCFSFEEKKGMTTGDGGMIVSNDKEYLKKLKPMRWVGIDKDTWRRTREAKDNVNELHWYYEINDIGFKYNMNNVAAAIGLAQLKKINQINETKNKAIRLYQKRLAENEFISHLLPYKYMGVNSSYWLFGLRVPDRNSIIKYLSNKKIATGVHFTPLNKHRYFSSFTGITNVADKIYDNIITLPLYPGIEEVDVNNVCDCILDYINCNSK